MKILPAILIISFILGGIYATQRPNHKVVFPNAQRSNFHSEIQRTAQKIREKREEARARAVFQNRVSKTKAVLAGSPLEPFAQSFVECEGRYNLRFGTLAGIARMESTYGRHYSLTNNPFNYGIYLGLTFDSMDSAACHVAKKLKEDYDTQNILAMARKYAPSSDGNNPERWAKGVEEIIYKVN